MTPACPVLGIDPSSTAIGYGLLAGLEPEDLLDAGVIRPSASTRELHRQYPALAAWLDREDLAAYRRIANATREIQELISEHRPVWVLVEVPSGLIGTGAKRGARGALTIYGVAAGVIFETARSCHDPDRVLPVTERAWTHGQGDKDRRQTAIWATYRGRYRMQLDRGGDAADAIGLCRWWLTLNKPRIPIDRKPAAVELDKFL